MICNIIPVSATELDTENQIQATDETVIQMAENFALAAAPGETLSAGNPQKFYSDEGQAIGYIVNYYKDSVPYGYVIFDSSEEDIISEYSIGEGSLNPYEAALSKSEVATLDSSENTVCKLNPLTYAVVNSATGYGITNYGDSVEVAPPIDTRSSKPTNWQEVFFDEAEIYEEYTHISSNNLPEFISVNDSIFINSTNRYACVVTAAYACATYLGATNFTNVADEYLELWDLTNTRVDHIGEDDNVTYGITNVNDAGPGVVEFCQRRGLNVGFSHDSSASFNFFKTNIDAGYIGMVHAWIIGNDNKESGHTMTVEGYASIKSNSTGTVTNTLMVYDGWQSNVRFLNYNFSKWSQQIEGTVFA